ncbi:MAG: class I SAM-dependent methyltransferase [Actinomycetota bacterium]
MIRQLLLRNGADMSGMDAILDFACGCGRIARWWADLDGPEIHGCDYNPDLTGWTRSNLPFMKVATNGAGPPLPYSGARFDFVYAISAFTHLPEEAQHRWMSELRRILRPDGLLLFTVHGERYADQLSRGEREAFLDGELVVRFEEVPGTNLCATFHPPAYVTGQMLDGFELVEWVDENESGSRSLLPMPRQDNYLVRKSTI